MSTTLKWINNFRAISSSHLMNEKKNSCKKLSSHYTSTIRKMDLGHKMAHKNSLTLFIYNQHDISNYSIIIGWSHSLLFCLSDRVRFTRHVERMTNDTKPYNVCQTIIAWIIQCSVTPNNHSFLIEGCSICLFCFNICYCYGFFLCIHEDLLGLQNFFNPSLFPSIWPSHLS